MSDAFARILPLLVACWLFGRVTGHAPLAAALAGLSLLPALLPLRLRLRPLGQAALALALGGLALAVATSQPAPPGTFRGVLGPLAEPLSLFSIALAASRGLLRAPWGGPRITLAIGVGALVGCGSSRLDLLYPTAIGAYLLGASFELQSREGAPLVLLGEGLRQRALALLLLMLGTAFAGALGYALPRLHRRAVGYWGSDAEARSGFSDGPLELGRTRRLLLSDTIVGRVRNLRGPTLLRGETYNSYSFGALRSEVSETEEYGQWSSTRRERGEATVLPPDRPGSVRVELEPIDSVHLFLPLELGEAHAPGPARVASDGVLSVPRLPGARSSYSYDPGPREDLRLGPPEAADLSVPRPMRSALLALSETWTSPADPPARKLDQLTARLMTDYTYSLDVPPTDLEPVLGFLLEGKQGYCEHFASALVLLARAQRIPARLVSGFRVTEASPIGGYHFIRERSAHAWVEAYLPAQGWVTVDPTPPASLDLAGPAVTPPLEALLDLAWVRLRALAGHGLSPGVAVAVGLTALLLGALGLVFWRSLEGEAIAAGDRAAALDPPLRCLPLLLDHLAARGFARRPDEPIERLALRLDEAGADPEGAALLRRYAALRYGRLGDPGALAAQIEQHVRGPRAR